MIIVLGLKTVYGRMWIGCLCSKNFYRICNTCGFALLRRVQCEKASWEKKKKSKKKKKKNGLKPVTFLETGNGSTRDLVTWLKISKAAIKRDKIQLISRK